MAPWTGSAPHETPVRTDGVRSGGAVCTQAKNAGVNNTSELCDARESDMVDMIALCVNRAGGNLPTANLPMNTYRHTGVGAAQARTDYARASQVQDGALIYAEVAGTANAIELTTTPTCSPVAGMVIGFVAAADSTTAVTVDLNGTVDDLQIGGSALAGGEINNGQFHKIGFDGTQWQLLNPYITTAGIGAQPLDADLTAIAALSPTNDDIIQRKAGAWTNRTIAQLLTDLAAAGTTFQPLDSDLTAIAALTTTSIGRSLLAASDAAALRTILGAVLTDAVFPGALCAIIEDRKSAGTDGGTFSSGADRTRTLNTLAYNRNTAFSLSSNRFTVPAGDWDIEWSAPAMNVDSHQTLLYDFTNSAEIARGTGEYADDSTSGSIQSRSFGSARVSVAGSTAYELRHVCEKSASTVGFGSAADLGGSEVYARVIVRAA